MKRPIDFFLCTLAVVCAFGACLSEAHAQPGKAIYQFTFGGGKAEAGQRVVTPEMTYDAERGYGFEAGSTVSAIIRNESVTKPAAFCTSDKPFFFSVKVPEGNYLITVTLGDPKGESTTTIKAELRRLMLEQVTTKKGGLATRTFTVNVRTPAIAGGTNVKLKDRERANEMVNWDDKLTFEFNGSRPCVAAMEIAKADPVTTVFLLGDSTVCDQPQEAYASWGQMLPRFFRPEVVVANHAESGESLKSSLGARRLDKVAAVMKPGDYLLIQYGHNDQKDKSAGAGAFTTYKANLKLFVAEARKRGGIPVVVTSMHRRTFGADAKITNSLGDYPEAVRQVAREESVPLIDLHAMSQKLYEALGPEGAQKLFNHPDGTHHCNYGAYELAKCIVEGIKANHLGIAKYVVADVRPFDPAHPDPVAEFKVPASPQSASRKPDGN